MFLGQKNGFKLQSQINMLCHFQADLGNLHIRGAHRKAELSCFSFFQYFYVVAYSLLRLKLLV